MSYATITVPEFDPATALNLTDHLWLTQGLGVDRNKKLSIELLWDSVNNPTIIGTIIHNSCYIVSTQIGFNEIIERVAANQYKIKDGIKKIQLRFLIGGYLCYGGTSFLSDGDSWGYLETNECSELFADNGAYLNPDDNQFYIETNTDYCLMKNISVIAPGSSVAPIDYTFLLNADFVIYENCRISNRLSDIVMTGFKESATSSHNETAAYIGCKVEGLDGGNPFTYSNPFGFCHNIQKCYEDKNKILEKVNWKSAQLIGSGLSISGIGNSALTALNETDIVFIDTTLKELRTYRFNGSTWSLVGSGLSISGIGTPALTTLNETDIVFIDAALEKLRTYRFNGSTWSLVGSGLSISGIGTPALTTLNETDIVFIDYNLKELRTYRFNGSTWSLVGSGLSISGISIPALTTLNETDIVFIDTALEELRTYRFDFYPI